MIEESEKQIHELIDNESEALRIAKETKNRHINEVNAQLADLAEDKKRAEEVMQALQREEVMQQ